MIKVEGTLSFRWTDSSGKEHRQETSIPDIEVRENLDPDLDPDAANRFSAVVYGPWSCWALAETAPEAIGRVLSVIARGTQMEVGS